MKREDLIKFAPMSDKTYDLLMMAARSVEEGKIVKKKITVAFVLSAIMVMLIIGALAATLLSSKEFVNTILAPMATKTQSDRWSKEELKEILRIAEENSILLSEESLQCLQGEDGYWKEEVMRLFAKIDLGFYPSTWSLEDQAWYDQLLVDIGVSETRSRLLPEAGEISEEEALAIVTKHIVDTYDASFDSTDEITYLRHIVYSLRKEGGIVSKIWSIEYMATDLEHDSYVITLTSEGVIEEATVVPGVHLEGANITRPEQIFERYEQVYGSRYGWASDIWVSFHQALDEAGSVPETEGNLSIFVDQKYGLPDGTAISRDAAILAAQEAIVAKGYSKKEDIYPPDETTTTIYLLDGDFAIWKIRVVTTEYGDYLVELDAHSGQVLRIVRMALADHSSRFFVLESVYKNWFGSGAGALSAQVCAPDSIYQIALENVKNAIKPEAWGYAAAPVYFWIKMESMGFDTDNADRLVGEWIDKYGEDTRFWPLAQKAIITIWAYGLESGNMTIQGIPAETDIQQEQAETIAWNAYHAEYKQRYGKSTPLSFVLSYRFAYNVFNRDDHVWRIDVIDPTFTADQYRGCVYIDAATGDVLFTDMIADNNEA